ncbi:MAG: DNA alkylation repair protein [Labilithrix sp.]|nr:DNA alkylation repair protein [Labilithrix sp.]MCW5810206.1 DNA alkylation repair protein [Labilithrix sp.]
MGEPLKVFFNRDLVRRLAGEIGRVHPGFEERAFVERAAKGLEELELLERGKHIAGALAEHLPGAYPKAIGVLLRSLGPRHASDELAGAGMAPFFYLPHTIFVAEHGLGHFDLSLEAQRELTKRFTAEWSIRPYLAKDPERTFAFLERWARDRDPHVRRLVSEGTRIRLPWAMRVAWLDANPTRILSLLERLKDDPASVVRRSVANNLNDLGKVHPKLVFDTCASWLDGASAERRALVEHALRSAVKRGETRALELLGYGKKPAVAIAEVSFEPRRVRIGGTVAVGFVLRSTSGRRQDLLVDLAVHFVKARGHASAKVFKLKRVTLPPRGEVVLQRRISLAVHTTRKPNPGRHAVDVLVNGVPTRAGTFDVLAQLRSRTHG